MIKSNLNVKLAENNLKISKVYNDTGISRSTLTTLATGDPKGIQLETINTLCRYLDITPGELFIYAPIDITVSITDIEILKEDYSSSLNIENQLAIVNKSRLNGTMYLNIETKNKKYSLESTLTMSTTKNYLNIDVTPLESDDNYAFFVFDYGELPRELEIQLATTIGTKVKELLDNTPVNELGLLNMGNDIYPIFEKPSVIFNL